MHPRYQDGDITIYNGHALEVLRELPEKSISCCVTSPPYMKLRSFPNTVTVWDDGSTCELGQEPTVELFTSHLMLIFNEVYRVLRDDATCFVNIGELSHQRMTPEYFAIAMKENGWHRFNTIIWSKTNVLPQPSKRKFTTDFEYVYCFAKDKSNYYFEQQFEPLSEHVKERLKYENWNSNYIPEGREGFMQYIGGENFNRAIANMRKKGVRNMRSVWRIPSKGSDIAHHAMFPERLVERCILAGCPEDGVVLDCFGGVFTSGIVAVNNGRKAIMIEMNGKYCDIGIKRFKEETAQQKLVY